MPQIATWDPDGMAATFFLKDPNGTNIDEIEHDAYHLVNYLIGWHVVDIWHAKTMKA